MSTEPGRIIRFGVFEIDLSSGELRKSGLKVKLQDQPFQILAMLLERPGEVVTREELQQRLWRADTFVDFDHSLNAAIKKLRQALGDSADNPRFVETLARRGYRFIAPVEGATLDKTSAQFLPMQPESERLPGRDESARGRVGRTWPHRFLSLAVLLALLGVGVWVYKSRLARDISRRPQKTIPLTSFPGLEAQPALSPDGQRVAFAWNGEQGDNFDIYVKQIDAGSLVRLTTDPLPDMCPSWSPDGRRLAFLRISGGQTQVLLIGASGSLERRLSEWHSGPSPFWFLWWFQSLSWSSDGKFVVMSNLTENGSALLLLSVETGEKTIITSPPQGFWDLVPAFSPDGRSLAFVRAMGTYLISDIYLASLAGHEVQGRPRRLTFDNQAGIRGLTWAADSRSIILSSDRDGSQSLWRIPASGGEPQKLTAGGENAHRPSVDRNLHRLVYEQVARDMNIWRIDLSSSNGSKATARRNLPTRLIASTKYDSQPQFSPDGKKIAFVSDRSGNAEIWVCGSDGSHSSQITEISGPYVGSPRWSPDGQLLAFDSVKAGTWDLYVVGVEGGLPLRLTGESSADVRPSWSHDGRWIYFGSNRSGDWQVWKLPASGGSAVRLTQHGGFEAIESPDGRLVYFTKPYPAQGIWSISPSGGEERPVLEKGMECFWDVADPGIFLLTQHGREGPAIEFFSFLTAELKIVGSLAEDTRLNPQLPSFTMSRDGRSLAYVQEDQTEGDLILVENFR